MSPIFGFLFKKYEITFNVCCLINVGTTLHSHSIFKWKQKRNERKIRAHLLAKCKNIYAYVATYATFGLDDVLFFSFFLLLFVIHNAKQNV